MERRNGRDNGYENERVKKAEKMTQEEVAECICCKKSLISQYESDKVDIKWSVIVELAELLGTTIGYLLNGEIGYYLDENEKQMLELMAKIKNLGLKKVAIEQVKVLTNA